MLYTFIGGLADITLTDDGPFSAASSGTTTLNLGSPSSTGPDTYALMAVTASSDLDGNVSVTLGGEGGTILKEVANLNFAAYGWLGVVYWEGAQSGSLIVTGPTGDLTRAVATIVSLENVGNPTDLNDEDTGTSLTALSSPVGGIRLVAGYIVDTTDFALSLVNATELDEFAVGAGTILNAVTGYDLGEGSDTITLTNCTRGVGVTIR